MSKNLIKIEMSRLRQIKVATDLFSLKVFLPNTDHVIFTREFFFRLFMIHA